MHNLERLNEKFHEFLTDGLSKEQIEKLQLPDLSLGFIQTDEGNQMELRELKVFLSHGW